MVRLFRPTSDERRDRFIIPMSKNYGESTFESFKPLESKSFTACAIIRTYFSANQFSRRLLRKYRKSPDKKFNLRGDRARDNRTPATPFSFRIHLGAASGIKVFASEKKKQFRFKYLYQLLRSTVPRVKRYFARKPMNFTLKPRTKFLEMPTVYKWKM